MKRIASASFLAALAVATVYGKPVTGSSSASSSISSASSSISIEEMSSSDIEKAFGGSGFGGSFGGKGFSFGQGVTSYTGKPSVVLKPQGVLRLSTDRHERSELRDLRQVQVRAQGIFHGYVHCTRAEHRGHRP